MGNYFPPKADDTLPIDSDFIVMDPYHGEVCGTKYVISFQVGHPTSPYVLMTEGISIDSITNGLNKLGLNELSPRCFNEITSLLKSIMCDTTGFYELFIKSIGEIEFKLGNLSLVTIVNKKSSDQKKISFTLRSKYLLSLPAKNTKTYSPNKLPMKK